MQWILALLFLGAGAMKLVQPFDKLAADERMSWVNDVGPGVTRLAGATEVLAAIGMVLPGLLDIAQVLTPLAGIGLAAQQIIAAFWVHQPRSETQMIAVNLVLAVVALVVGIGRFVEPLA